MYNVMDANYNSSEHIALYGNSKYYEDSGVVSVVDFEPDDPGSITAVMVGCPWERRIV